MGWEAMAGVAVALCAVIGLIIGGLKHAENKRSEIKDGASKSVSRVYERLDECKVEMNNKVEKGYVRKDICKIINERIENDLKDIKQKVELIPEIAAQLKVLVNGSKRG